MHHFKSLSELRHYVQSLQNTHTALEGEALRTDSKEDSIKDLNNHL